MESQRTASLTDYVKAWPQYLMPGHLLSLGMLWLTRVRHEGFKNGLIEWFIKQFRIDMGQAVESEARAYADFNSFFTRALKPGMRPLDTAPEAVCSPVDGTISQIGTIEHGRVFQAKGHDFSVQELLGGDELAEPFLGGCFTTIYLSPRDYHRIHIPVDGRLRGMLHVPGRLFSVNPATTRAIPRLFARNERVVALFDTELGPMAMVMVGAVFVGSIETVWHGVVTPPAGKIVRAWRYDGAQAQRFDKGDEIGRFNMGSTVILLFGPGALAWEESLAAHTPVLMGQRIGQHS
ncbi:MAG: archaetidylserine decarboxylase [Gammaproteobacteria bacterium]|nr:archaetidylserine decarboxylase [Gammaproteobacteria bacterium]